MNGSVYDAENPYVRVNYMVVNKRTGKGVFGNHKGMFAMEVLRRDSLIFTAADYYPVKVNLRDSCASKSCKIRIGMRKKEIQLMAVDILPIREHTQITKEIKDLVEPKSIDRVSADGLTSPITALYQMFSKLAREQHEVAVLEAEDRKRDVLKELFAKYVEANIIDLDEEQFDDFLNTSEFDANYLRTLSDYALIKYIQYRYYSYLAFNEFYSVFKRLERNEYELMLLEARGEKQAVVCNIFKKFIDKNIWSDKSHNPELLFEFVNYCQFNAAELMDMNDYALIVTVKRKYDQFRGNYGNGKR